MHFEFVKMHGLGNDFIVVELPANAPLPSAAQWRALSDRHTGIGFDQALVLQPPRRADSDVYYRIFNADGTEVEQCGNGARCVAALLHARLGNDRLLRLDSDGGLLQARVLADGRVAVDMGPPNFDPRSLPFDAPERRADYSLRIDGGRYEIGAVSMGNPHAVLRVTDVQSAPVARLGAALQADARFPRQVNVGFMQILDRRSVRLRVFERGVGETLACGTGACAAVAVGRDRGWLDSDVDVNVPGGVLSVHWAAEGESVWLTGPAQLAFRGTVDF